MEGPQPATAELRGPKVLTFHVPPTQKIKGDHSYQRPMLPTQKHWFTLLSPWQQQHLLEQTHLYIRMFCTGLCGFTFILLLCISPLPWVKFLLAKNGLELHTGLWTLCEHELCWSHVPSNPYYLQISRIFFLISALTASIILVWVIDSCRHGKEPPTSLDQGVAILSLTSENWPRNPDLLIPESSVTAFCCISLRSGSVGFFYTAGPSGLSLFVCLVLFLMQVKKYTSYTMGSSYLWIFHFNWWGSFFYIVAGLVSFFNYKTFGILPSDPDATKILLVRRRLGINPKMWSTPVKEEDPESDMIGDHVVDIEAIVASLEDGHVNNNK